MLRLTLALPLLALFDCGGDETVAAYGAAGHDWQLQRIDDKPFKAKAILTFPEPGRIAGQAPCNSYSGTLDAPYPWFDITGLSATEMACPELEAEGTFFAALLAMTQAEVSGSVLILRNDDGHELLFKAAE